MRIFTTRAFARLKIANELSADDLIKAVAEMNEGLWDANLGGQVYKKRVAFAGRGKRAGSRTLVAFRRYDRAIFVYAFAKNQRDNIVTLEKQALKRLAHELLGYDQQQITRAIEHGSLVEVEVKDNDKVHSRGDS